MLVEQLAEKSARPYSSSPSKDKIGRQLHAQAFIGENLFITYPVMVQKYGQVLDKEASLLLLRRVQAVGRSEPGMDPLPDISTRWLNGTVTHAYIADIV